MSCAAIRSDNNTVVENIGYAATVLLGVMSLPQLVRLLKDGSTVGVSVGTWLLFTLNGILWFGYGVQRDAPAMIVGNSLFLITVIPVTGIVVADQFQFSFNKLSTFIVLILVTAGCLWACATIVPLTVLSVVAVCSSVLGMVPQLLTSFRNVRSGEKSSEVALGTILLLAIAQALWLTYGWVRGEPAVVWANIPCLTFTILVFWLEVVGRRQRLTC